MKAEREQAMSRLARFNRKSSGAAMAASTPSIPNGGGTPLPSATRAQMETKLGADLSSVKVHTSGDSARAASEVGAKAFTVGTDIHFNAGQFAPGTKEGDRLLAHELTHVVQAKNSGSVIQRKEDEHARRDQPSDSGAHEDKSGTPPTASDNDEDGADTAAVSEPHEPAEKEADEVGDRIADELHDTNANAAKKDGKQAKTDSTQNKSERGDAKSNDATTSGGNANADSSGREQAKEEKKPAELASPDASTKPGGDGAHKIQAKLEGVGRKIFRAAGPSPAPSPVANGATSTPADPWTQFCSTLPGDLKDKALGIADEEQRTALRTVGLEFARAFRGCPVAC